MVENNREKKISVDLVHGLSRNRNMNYSLSWSDSIRLVATSNIVQCKVYMLCHPEVQSSRHIHSLLLSMVRRCLPELGGLSWGHFSSLHFVVHTSQPPLKVLWTKPLCPSSPQVNHNTDSLTACQCVKVHAGVRKKDGKLEMWGGRHMKGLYVFKMVVKDGRLIHGPHYALPWDKEQSSGNDMTPLDLLSCDIFVYHVCIPTAPVPGKW